MTLVTLSLEGRHVGLVMTPEGGTVLCAVDGTTGEGAVFERIDLAHGRVALRAGDGSYLVRHADHSAPTSDDAPHLSSELSQCAAFEELLLPCGQVSLRGCDLRYLGVHRSGRVVADRIVNGSRERFTYVDVPTPPPSVPAQPESSTRETLYAVV